MQVALYQFDMAWEDKPANYKRVASRVAAAGLPPGTLVVLPEMFATGYSMNAAAITEPVDGPTAAFLAGLAAEHRVYVVGGAAVADGQGKPRNEALAFDPGGRLVARYAKRQLFSLAKENVFYTPGEEPAAFDWEGCRVGLNVCYDLRFPEVFRPQAQAGVDLYAVIANWPVTRIEHWVALARARAIENQAYVVAVNRCGRDPWLEYTGRSQIVGPHGNVLADAGGAEGIVTAEVDLIGLREYRRAFPALADMRPDLL